MAIFELEEDGITVIQARLAERLGHSPPTVSEVIRTLLKEGTVTKSGRGISLTESGRQKAQSIVRKHRLAERLLVDILGLDWHLAHEEAGRWEHVISDRVAGRIAALTANPSTCPHGNPIPGTIQLPDDGRVRLADASVGKFVSLVRIGEGAESKGETLSYLFNSGISIGTTLKVSKPLKPQTVRVKVDSRFVELDANVSQFLWVVDSP